MRSRHLLPFVGVIAIASTVAMVAGIGTTDSKTRHETKGKAAGKTFKVPSGQVGSREPVVPNYGDDGVNERAGAGTPIVNTGWKQPVKLKNKAGNVTKCGATWSGAADSAGQLYHACGSKLHVRGALGAPKQEIEVGAGYPLVNGKPTRIGMRDVTPSPDGKFIYYTVGERGYADTGKVYTAAHLAAGWGSVHRVAWNGSAWKRDSFKFGPFKLYGGTPWEARYLTAGSDGMVYASVNAFIFAIDKTGRIRADEFGQYSATGTKVGEPIAGYDKGFDIVEGISLSPDGRYLFAVDERWDQITRFSRDASGAWVLDKTVGVRDGNACSAGSYSAPYDLGVSTTSVFIANTTCGEIRQLDLNLVEKGSVMKLAGFLPHGLVISKTGSFLFPYRNEIYLKK